MEVPFYFTVKEFKEKYFWDFNKYREYNNVTLVEFLRLVGNNIFRAYKNEKLLKLYIGNSENIELDKECYIEAYEWLYMVVNETGGEEDKKTIKDWLGDGSKKDIERVITAHKEVSKDYDISKLSNGTLGLLEMINNVLIYVQYINVSKAIIEVLIREKYNEELIDDKIANNNTEQDFSNNENKEKVILLEKMGIIDFIKEKQSNPNNIKQTAEILSSFTGIKSATLYSYLRPMLSPHRDDKDKNSPYKNPENLQRANKTLHKLPIK